MRDYDPQWQYDSKVLSMRQQDRPGYEAACETCGVTPHTDAEIEAQAYALKYAEFLPEDWMEKAREARVLFVLDGGRLIGINNERVAARRSQPQVQVDRPVQRCAICGEPAEMSASLGPACQRHYDDLSA